MLCRRPGQPGPAMSLRGHSRALMAEATAKLYSLDEIAQHNTSSDCWIAVGGKVYDVTRFLDDHPGGGEVIVASTGKDATDDFENVGHSNSARAMMNEYLIGRADQSSFSDARSVPTSGSASRARSGGGGGSNGGGVGAIFKSLRLAVVVPLLLLCFAILLVPRKRTEEYA